LISHWKTPADIAIGAKEPLTAVTSPDTLIAGLNGIEQMMYTDLHSYLPDDILVKVDRASMASSLEARAVYLDYRIVELALGLPLDLKIRGGRTKWILRKILDKYVPADLVERPKMGFGIPLDEWLRGPLRGWAEELLDEGRLKKEGYFNPDEIRIKWREHLSGKRNWQYHLWDILMFQAWQQRWM
jgi:asparagine synthase (glutamine-hydrolysing)